jgi:subtilisin family serine protease
VLLRRVAAVAALAAAFSAGGAQGAVPSDPLANSWTYRAAGLPGAWDLTTGSPAVVIAVVDSGVDGSHPDLAGAVGAGYDLVDDDTTASDGQGHGTAVAGIAAARANNGIGAAGVCWTCRIMPLRVIGPEGYAPNARTAAAIDYAVDHGAAVVNISLYGENLNSRLQDAVRRARAAGVVVVAAAGNEGGRIREYPAAYPPVLSVGATGEDGRLTSYSSRGDWVKLAAPACAPTTQLGGGFGAGCGTSGATPVVAGIAALLRSRAPFATVTDIERALASTARPVTGVRFGRVDAFAALQRLGRPGPRLLPTIRGSPYVGGTLTAYSGTWSGAPLELAYRWGLCRTAKCARVTTVGSGRTYTLRSADRGRRLRLAVTASDGARTISAVSAPTRVVSR